MPDYPRFTINRALVLILPNQPFVDWSAAAAPGPNPIRLALEDLREKADAFLLPESVMEDEELAVKWVGKCWRTFFEHLLSGQYVDETLWPQGRSLKMFRQWVHDPVSFRLVRKNHISLISQGYALAAAHTGARVVTSRFPKENQCKASP